LPFDSATIEALIAIIGETTGRISSTVTNRIPGRHETGKIMTYMDTPPPESFLLEGRGPVKAETSAVAAHFLPSALSAYW
jgi:hypothetical protein